MNNSSEKIRTNPEYAHDPEALKQAGIERQLEIQEKLEKRGERQKENINDVQHEALEAATSIKQEKAPDTTERTSLEHQKDRPLNNKVAREASFNTTMKEVQAEMSPQDRAFSKMIHNKTVEKVSDAAAETIARPNAMLTGAVFAFILTLGTYLVAKNLGYPLSGFETIGAFILGWVIGIIYDFLKVMITGRK